MRKAAAVTRLQPAAPRSSPWITPKEAANYLGVSVDAIYDACARKGLRHVKLGHSTIRLQIEWVDDWAAQHTRK